MAQYQYFIREGNKYHLKSRSSAAVIRTVFCLAIAVAIYMLVPAEKKIGAWGAGFFVVFALVNLLKATKKLTIDCSTQTITHKNNVLTPEATYHFNDFVRFYVLSSSYAFKFLTLDVTAFLVFEQNGREKQVPVVVGLFSARPAQNAVNELSEIMGVEAA